MPLPSVVRWTLLLGPPGAQDREAGWIRKPLLAIQQHVLPRASVAGVGADTGLERWLVDVTGVSLSTAWFGRLLDQNVDPPGPVEAWRDGRTAVRRPNALRSLFANGASPDPDPSVGMPNRSV